MSLFSSVELAPRDPILGLNEQFAADANPNKVNLGVGVYFDENGKLPLLACVQAAENAMMATPKPRGYLPIDGIAAYDDGVKKLVFGADSEPYQSGRIATVQGLGGTGALKIGADFLKHLNPAARVLISDPSWENHRALFTQAGFEVGTYRYYDAATRSLNFDGMLADLQAAAAGTIVVLHACCHNPTGVDLTREQWRALVPILRERALLPFLDLAYQGYGEGVAEDAFAPRLLADAGLSFLIVNSFSKSMSVYGERAGALSVVCADRAEAELVLGQLKATVRRNYSSPPMHAAGIVGRVLGEPALRSLWESEVGAMRERILAMRRRLHAGLSARKPGHDFGFLLRQRGMFSYTGLTPAQVDRLRETYAVYLLRSGRICVAGLNGGNVERTAEAIAAVIEGHRRGHRLTLTAAAAACTRSRSQRCAGRASCRWCQSIATCTGGSAKGSSRATSRSPQPVAASTDSGSTASSSDCATTRPAVMYWPTVSTTRRVRPSAASAWSTWPRMRPAKLTFRCRAAQNASRSSTLPASAWSLRITQT